MRRGFILFAVFFLSGHSPGHAAECITFGGLVPAFASELSLEAKRAKIQFTPLNLVLDPKGAESRAYLLSNLESCSISGDCDSQVYLSDEKKCYRSVLTFRGKWKRLDREHARTFASLEIESPFEGMSRRRRRFQYDSGTGQFEETK